MFKKLFLIIFLSLISAPAQSDTPRYWIELKSNEESTFFGEVGSYFKSDDGTWGYKSKFQVSGVSKISIKLCKKVSDGIITKEINVIAYNADGSYFRMPETDWRLWKFP